MANTAITDRGPIEYTLKGEGPVVLYIHGGHSNCNEEFGVNSLVDNGFCLLVPSRPGYGRTPDSVGHTPMECADAMCLLLDQLNIDKVHVVCVSAGGPTGLVFASKYPKKIKKLVLESAVTKTWLEKSDTVYKIAKIIFHPKIERLTWKLLRIFNNLFPTYIARQFVPSFSTLNVEEAMLTLNSTDIDQIRRMNNRYSSGRGFMLDIEHNVDVEILRSIRCPTLIVHSVNDAVVDFSHAVHAKDNIANSILHASKSWGHLIWLGAEGALANERVIEFLRDN